MTLRREEYELLRRLADVERTSVRGVVVKAVREYDDVHAARRRIGMFADTAILWMLQARRRVEALRKELLSPPKYLSRHLQTVDGSRVYEYFQARFLAVLELGEYLERVEEELRALKKLSS